MNLYIRFLLALFFFFYSFSIWGLTDKTQELKDVQTKIVKVAKDIEVLTAEKSQQIEELKSFEKQYGESINALLSIRLQIKNEEENLKALRAKISSTEKNIRNHQHSLEALIRSAFVIGGQDGFKVFLNQHDPNLTGRMMIFRDYIAKARFQKINAIREDIKVLHQLDAQKDFENQMLQSALEKKQKQTEDLQILKNKREKLVLQLTSDYQAKKRERENLLANEKKLQALVASLQKNDDNDSQKSKVDDEASQSQPQLTTINKSQKNDNNKVSNNIFSQSKGDLPWPVEGEIVERFGNRRFETSWEGDLISAKEGAEVHAIAAGRVVFADWLLGYGLMLILDHGNGYMSLYAYNQSLRKNVGEQVLAGDSLALVGRSGARQQAALYFGIRKNGRPLDPEHWCRKPAKD